MVSNTSIILARIFSAYLIVTGAGFLISPDYYAAMVATANSDPVLINLSGMVHFLIGMTILTLHFKWRKVLNIIVSLLGLMFVLKGGFLIALPQLTLQSGGNDLQATLVLPAIGFLAAGLFTAYLAWFRHRLER